MPRALFAHLLDRIRQRQIPGKQLTLMVEWQDLQPGVPSRKWFKRFPGMIVCGEEE